MKDCIRGEGLFDFDPVFEEETRTLLSGSVLVDITGSEYPASQYTLNFYFGRIHSRLVESEEKAGELTVLPAIESDDGYVEYRDMGVLHRDDGPAVKDYTNAYEEYWVDGKRHRLDGPAVTYSNGDEEYWINGVLIFTDRPEPEIKF